MNWNEATDWEASWWSNCKNTFCEEYKQIIYARKIGLKFIYDGKSYFSIDIKDKKILDIGGGPCSLLLKTNDSVNGTIVDPFILPNWCKCRYDEVEIDYYNIKAEDILNTDLINETFDEVWIYNVLQHVENPQLIIENAKNISKIIRLFEWIDESLSPGHIHSLREETLNYWLKGEGKVELINENYAVGKAYYGIFLGRKE